MRLLESGGLTAVNVNSRIMGTILKRPEKSAESAAVQSPGGNAPSKRKFGEQPLTPFPESGKLPTVGHKTPSYENSHWQPTREGPSPMTQKRRDYISWNDYFMGVAILSAHRSKDPNSQVGACIVSPQNKIVGIGYNGFPLGCSDDELPWAREADSYVDTKYAYVCHAELNAVMNKNAADLTGSTIYVTLFPCNECTKLLIQSGIAKIIYLSDKYHDTDSSRAARRMLDMAKIQTTPFTPDSGQVTINFAREAEDVTNI